VVLQQPVLLYVGSDKICVVFIVSVSVLFKKYCKISKESLSSLHVCSMYVYVRLALYLSCH